MVRLSVRKTIAMLMLMMVIDDVDMNGEERKRKGRKKKGGYLYMCIPQGHVVSVHAKMTLCQSVQCIIINSPYQSRVCECMYKSCATPVHRVDIFFYLSLAPFTLFSHFPNRIDNHQRRKAT